MGFKLTNLFNCDKPCMLWK